ncbi:MAG: sigma-70 family RNA polymerase sigma factor [Muribaculaceae bacterium]|nr:sigma-70 family RNA polymerase sigma factor [Muribaculaceae bacterium]
MDSSAFKRLLLPHYRRMYATAITILRNSDDASDAVQEAFTRLWEKRDDLPNIDTPEAYCVTTIKRVCIDRIRKNTLPINEVTEDTLLISDDSDIQADNRESLQLVTLLMNKLPEQQRQVLQLRAFNDCSLEEIESITGLTGVNVRTLLSRARRRMKELFNSNI